MNTFIKNYMDIIEDISLNQEERIDAIVSTYEALKEKKPEEVYDYIVRPLLIEYRDSTDNETIEAIKELLQDLLKIIL